MALRFIDSFDHVANATDVALKYDTAVVNAIVSGRFGNALELNSNNTTRNVVKVLDAQTTWIIGFAFYIERYDTAAAIGFDFVNVQDGAGNNQFGLRLDANLRLFATRNGTTIGGSTGEILLQDTWYYIELKGFIHDTTGTLTVHVNEQEDFALTNVDTRAFGTTADRFQLRSQTGTANPQPNFHFDDLYVCDGTTGAGSNPCNDFLGDCRVECITPNGNGNSSQFDGSDGNQTDNYLLVDESTPDSDTTYVESADVSDKDTYAMSNLSTVLGTVYGVQPVPFARKTDAGARSFVSVARLSGNEVDSAAHVLLSTYRFFPDIRETKPGGGDWTISDVNSSEFGVKVDS